MLSYWEKQSLLHYDCILLGSGIVGLSAAISIKERFPKKRVLVLEKGLLPTGASTRNAGFACIGSLTEILDDLEHMPENEVVALVQMRRKGLQLLRSRIGDDRMQYRENGSFELISAAEEGALDKMNRVNELLFDILPGPAFSMADDQIAAKGIVTEHLVQNNYEGELHTGMMMRTLIDIALEKGIEIKTGCDVTSYEEHANGVNVVINNQLTFSARHMVICTNAFAKKLLPGLDVTPGRGQVLITAPVKGLPFKGVYHFDEGYYYFRELNGRVLFGGGRNQDFKGEATTDIALNDKIQQDLENKLRTIILPRHAFTIEDRWSGIMAFGKTKQPIVKAYSPRICLAVRMGGMGVAVGAEVGRQVAALLQD